MTAEIDAGTEAVAAWLYDGFTANRHLVTAEVDREGLALTGADLADHVPWISLTAIDILPEGIRLGRSDRPGWRLIVPADAPPALLARLPAPPRYGRWIDRFGFFPMLLVFALISSGVAYVAVNTPNWLGQRLPVSWETGMSDDGLKDLAANTCHTPESDAALAALVAELDEAPSGGDQATIRIELIKADIANAVALPGGHVLLFDGLAEGLDSPDALAGVIGHEIGHVRKRHVMQAMLREFGISMVLSGLKSGVTNTLGRMATLRYSREAETEADQFARTRLSAAAISPMPTARFFETLAEQDRSEGLATAAYLNSHPDPAARGAAFREAYRRNIAYRPALDAAGFRAIQLACAKDRGAKPL
ncbi:M48 family metallopeptidase [Novosphingobium sp.]|uniref:M48 family metallopeptidase n=1 Tax=Novosphingobium sp. TaxID=1874826 RepID=UPI003BAB57A8